MHYTVVQRDLSSRKEVFRSCFKAGLIGGILFSFIAWIFLGIFGGNITYSDIEKNRLKNLAYRLGIGTSIGFYYGILLFIVLLMLGIQQRSVQKIIMGFVLLLPFILLGGFCVKKYKRGIPVIKEQE